MTSPRVRCRLSSLQTKGIFTLWLLMLADQITRSNAINFWSTAHQGLKNDSYQDKEGFTSKFRNSAVEVQECSASNQVSCTSRARPSILAPFRRLTRSLGGSRLDCCIDCSHCNTEALLACRGGHTPAFTGNTVELVGSAMPYGIPLNGWKVIFQAFLTTLNVLCWLLPLRSKKMSENKLGLSLANAFSGGVFLSSAFGHLIPECVHGFEGYEEVAPYLLVLSGYLLIFFVEKVAFDAHEIMHEMEHAQDNKNSENGDGTITSGRSAVILLGALAVHSVLEMTALGLADSFSDSAILTLSIALHQPAESIALLVAFLKSGMPKAKIIRFLSVFSAMGPIGVALGMAVNEFAAPIVDSIMVAVVAGTFVYVGATEVIPEEWEDSDHKWKKFFALMAGIISILTITRYTSSLDI